jgi:predicted lipid-binding transport protein (Tim44 family)
MTWQPHFSPATFLAGAAKAFRMVLDAYMQADRQTLAMLLAPPMYAKMEAALATRAQDPTARTIALVSMRPPTIVGVDSDRQSIALRVCFVTEQMSYTPSPEGGALPGSTLREMIEDIWTFHTDTKTDFTHWVVKAFTAPSPTA